MYFRCLGVISESSKKETERYVKKEEKYRDVCTFAAGHLILSDFLVM